MDGLLDYPWRIAVLAVLLAAVGIWFQVSEPQPVKSRTAQSEDWGLPVIVRQPGDKSLAVITANKLWGDAGSANPATAVSLNDPEWRFSGITQSGGEKMLLIMQDGKLLDQPLKIGDRLPGGAKILAIYDDHLCILVDGKKRTLGIFQ